jgi:hypothetical protein
VQFHFASLVARNDKFQYYGYVGPDDLFVHPKDIRFATNNETDKPARLVRRAESLGLSFTIRQWTRLSAHIVDDFTAAFLAHMQANNLSFNEIPSVPRGSSPGPSSSPPIPSSEPCWRLLYHKQVSRTATQFPKCFIIKESTTSLTYSDLQKVVKKFPTTEVAGVQHNLLIIGTVFDYLGIR